MKMKQLIPWMIQKAKRLGGIGAKGLRKIVVPVVKWAVVVAVAGILVLIILPLLHKEGPKGEQFYIKTLGGFEISDKPEVEVNDLFHARYRPVTPEVKKEIQEWQRTGKVDLSSPPPPATFFDPGNGDSLLFYVKRLDGLRFSTLPGYDPVTGALLKLATADVIQKASPTLHFLECFDPHWKGWGASLKISTGSLSIGEITSQELSIGQLKTGKCDIEQLSAPAVEISAKKAP